MRIGRIRLRAFVLVMLICGMAWASGGVYNFKGGVKTNADKGISKQELAPQEPEGWFYTWCYTFVLYLDDGSSAMIQTTYWRAAYLAKQNFTIFSYIDAQGNKHYWQDLVDEDEKSYTVDPPMLKMGKQYWKGYYPDFYVHMEGENLSADLHYKAKTPGWRPGEGPVHYGEPDGDWYDLLVVIPWAEVEGTMTVDGKERQVKGFGYSDHNTQTIFPVGQADLIVALRSFSDDYSVNFLEYIAPEKYDKERSTWIIVMKDDKILYATDKWEYELSDYDNDPRRNFPYPKKVKVTIDQPGIKLTGEIRGVKFTEALDVMDNVPDMFRKLANKLIKTPIFIRQNAEVDWHLQMGDLDEEFTCHGIFEYTYVN